MSDAQHLEQRHPLFWFAVVFAPMMMVIGSTVASWRVPEMPLVFRVETAMKRAITALLAVAIAAGAALPTSAEAQSWRDRAGNSASDRDYDRGWRGQGNSGG